MLNNNKIKYAEAALAGETVSCAYVVRFCITRIFLLLIYYFICIMLLTLAVTVFHPSFVSLWHDNNM